MVVLAVVLYVAGGMFEGYALFELIRQSRRADEILAQLPGLTLNEKAAETPGDDPLTPEQVHDTDDGLASLAKNQRASGVIVSALALGLVCGTTGNLISLLR